MVMGKDYRMSETLISQLNFSQGKVRKIEKPDLVTTLRPGYSCLVFQLI